MTRICLALTILFTTLADGADGSGNTPTAEQIKELVSYIRRLK